MTNLSFDAVFQRLHVDPLASGVQILSAAQLIQHARAGHGKSAGPFDEASRGFDPALPLLVCGASGRGAAGNLKRALLDVYPADHPVEIVPNGPATAANPVRTVSLGDLDQPAKTGPVGCVYLGPLDRLTDLASFETLREIVARLRAPNGCPWDREQTHQSMKKHFIEETYEAIAALDEDDLPKFAEELGDVLLQVVMHCQLGREARTFNLEDVLRAVNEKLIRRHPHVFGEVKVGSSAEVLRNWEAIKRTEGGAQKSSFATIPEAMPALLRADAVQSRAARHGWSPPTALPDLSALEQPGLDQADFRRELGEAFFELVALARRHDVDPEEALRLATNRFTEHLEQTLASREG